MNSEPLLRNTGIEATSQSGVLPASRAGAGAEGHRDRWNSEDTGQKACNNARITLAPLSEVYRNNPVAEKQLTDLADLLYCVFVEGPVEALFHARAVIPFT